jgi:hypothetical protein
MPGSLEATTCYPPGTFSVDTSSMPQLEHLHALLKFTNQRRKTCSFLLRVDTTMSIKAGQVSFMFMDMLLRLYIISLNWRFKLFCTIMFLGKEYWDGTSDHWVGYKPLF